MNKKRREKLSHALSELKSACETVTSVFDDESDAMYNMPDNLQYSEAYEKMETACDAMEDAVSDIQDAVSKIESAIEHINTAMYP